MIQLKILSGKKAGAAWLTRRFPVRIGRHAGADLQVEEEGVWERHVELSFHPGKGFLLQNRPEALTTVNGHAANEVLLRNGDVIGLGSLKLQFWLGETRQPGFGLRDALTWSGIAAVFFGQVGLIYWLVR